MISIISADHIFPLSFLTLSKFIHLWKDIGLIGEVLFNRIPCILIYDTTHFSLPTCKIVSKSFFILIGFPVG